MLFRSPKGYQISQYEIPVVKGGSVSFYIDKELKTVRLTRAHLEEDAGKSLHDAFPDMSGIDLNRAGTPLLEIVSEPEIGGAKEAVAYARALHSLVRWIGICDGNMQEGSFRCDANVSVRRPGESLGTRCEIKNLNSFRFMERAIEFEANRQIDMLEDGGKVVQETRLYDADKDETRSMRTKEDAQDYRYFPDPDLLPLVISEDDIGRIRKQLPELPESKRQRYVAEFGIPEHTAAMLTSSVDAAEYFEKAMSIIGSGKVEMHVAATTTANLALGPLLSHLNEANLSYSQSPLPPEELGKLQLYVLVDKSISGKIAKDVIAAVFHGSGASVDQIIEKQGLKQISDTGAIEKVVDEVLAANARQVQDYRAGREKAFNSLVGQVMKRTQGKANPAQVNEILRRKLK